MTPPAQYAGKCYLHPQSVRMLYILDTLRQASGGYPALYSGENLRKTHIDR